MAKHMNSAKIVDNKCKSKQPSQVQSIENKDLT